MTDARKALAEVELLINEYDPSNSDWGFRRGVINELLVAAQCSVEFDPSNHHNALKCPYCNPQGGDALRPLPGTREEVALDPRHIPDELIDRMACAMCGFNNIMQGNGRNWSDVIDPERGYWLACAKAGLIAISSKVAALPPAPMPEREGVREKLERFASEVERCEHGTFLIDIAKNIRAFATTLAPHDKTEG